MAQSKSGYFLHSHSANWMANVGRNRTIENYWENRISCTPPAKNFALLAGGLLRFVATRRAKLDESRRPVRTATRAVWFADFLRFSIFVYARTEIFPLRRELPTKPRTTASNTSCNGVNSPLAMDHLPSQPSLLFRDRRLFLPITARIGKRPLSPVDDEGSRKRPPERGAQKPQQLQLYLSLLQLQANRGAEPARGMGRYSLPRSKYTSRSPTILVPPKTEHRKSAPTSPPLPCEPASARASSPAGDRLCPGR